MNISNGKRTKRTRFDIRLFISRTDKRGERVCVVKIPVLRTPVCASIGYFFISLMNNQIVAERNIVRIPHGLLRNLLRLLREEGSDMERAGLRHLL